LIKDYKKAREHERTMNEDLEFLTKQDGKFDPYESIVTGNHAVKRSKLN